MALYRGTIPDSKEREAALDPAGSFIVQAPAGSGKTGLLIQRFLALLSLAEEPEEILAITFTRKAAGEMKERIIESLVAAKEGRGAQDAYGRTTLKMAEEALKRDSEKKWGLLENPSRLKVQTIDSLSGAVTRQMPLLSRLGAHPALNDNPDELYKEAARRAVAMLSGAGKDASSIREALRRLDNSIADLEKRLSAMLEKRDQWLRHIKRGTAEGKLREILEGSLKNLIEDHLKRAASLFPAHLAKDFLRCARFAASNMEDDKENHVAALKGINSLPGASHEELPLWQAIAGLLLTKELSWRSPKGVNATIGFPPAKDEETAGMKKGFQEVLESLSALEPLREELAGVLRLPPPRYEEDDWTALDAMLHLLPAAERHLNSLFAETGTLDYQAVSMAALDALGGEDEPTDLMLAMDLRIRHILVDEYQDTSRTQYELIRALTSGWEDGDGRTLFIVGDPMQSIYLFREAEVGLFLKAKDSGIGNIKLKPLALKCNFRSQKNIVEWVNSSFRGAFPGKEDAFMGAVTYAPSSAVKDPCDGAQVELNIFRAAEGARADLDDAEADGIVRAIESADKEDSVAILARSRSHLYSIIRALKEKGIDFRSEEIDPLSERPVVEDLLSLERALEHPFDRIAWLSVLRAPWCGLGLGDLKRLCQGDASSPVWALVNDGARIEALTEDGRRRLERFKEKMSKALSLRGRVWPKALLEGLWISLGGPACYADKDAIKDAEEFFDLVSAISSGGGVSALKDLEARVGKLYAGKSGAGSSPVEVMTIHKAKGLEFDRVIVPGAGKKPPNAEKKLLLWMERGDDLLLSPIEKKGASGGEDALYGYLSKTYGKKEQLEAARLFYVAATRAKKSLHIFGHVKEDSGKIRPEERSLLYQLRHIIRPETLLDLPPLCAWSAEVKRPRQGLKRLPLSWTCPPPAESAEADVERTATASRGEEPVFDWAGASIRHIGTAVHSYLSRIARDGVELWDRGRVKKEKEALSAMLSSLGLNRKESITAAEEAVRIISGALDDKKGRWILGSHSEAQTELRMTGVINEAIVRTAIDRTFVDDGDTRWVIDYKTGVHRGGSLEVFLRSEKERYAAQLEAYEAIFRARGEKRGIRKALYYPAIPAWIEL